MKDILVKIERYYMENVERKSVAGICVGLCGSAYFVLPYEEYKVFKRYLSNYVKEKKQRIF